MIEVRNVTKNFKDAKVVDSISFTVSPGEIVGLLGENGAGKTTTIRMISTMLQISKGEILVNNINVKKEPEKVRGEIGILFGGDVGLYDRLTGKENIKYFADLHGMSKSYANKRIEELNKRFGMEEYINKPVAKYSRGMKQKISITRAIIHAPSTMLFDEPTTGLDVGASRLIHEFILNCKKEGKAILLSSHSMKEVEKLCDRVIIIHKGCIIENSKIELLKDKYDTNDFEEIFVNLVGGK